MSDQILETRYVSFVKKLIFIHFLRFHAYICSLFRIPCRDLCGILLSVLLLACSSCQNEEINRTTSQTHQIAQVSQQYEFHVIEIDQCQYLFLELDRNNPHEGFGFFSHRGNCPNPIHYKDPVKILELYPPSLKHILEGVPLKRASEDQSPSSP